MSEQTHGSPQAMPCGCTGVCGCFGEPTESRGNWYSEDAAGNQYVFTSLGWMDLDTPEAQSLVATDPTYSGAVYESGGYWYGQDANGGQYLWTTSGWVPDTAYGQPTDFTVDGSADSSTFVVGPPTVDSSAGSSTFIVGPPMAAPSSSGGVVSQDLIDAAYASGDPLTIQTVQDLIETQNEMIQTAIYGDPANDGLDDETGATDWDEINQMHPSDAQHPDHPEWMAGDDNPGDDSDSF